MPIRINLLAETLAAEEARRKDPVKRALWICGLLVAAALGWSGVRFMAVRAAEVEAQEQEARWKKNENAFKVVTDAQQQLTQAERKLDALVRYSTNRFLWAPVLNGLQQAAVPVANVIQLEQFRAVQTFEQIAAVPASKDKKTPGKPAASVERISLILRARDYGNPNEADYNKFKLALSSEPYLGSLLQKNDGVRLASTLSGPIVDSIDPNKSFYQFILECRFQDVRRDE